MPIHAGLTPRGAGNVAVMLVEAWCNVSSLEPVQPPDGRDHRSFPSGPIRARWNMRFLEPVNCTARKVHDNSDFSRSDLEKSNVALT